MQGNLRVSFVLTLILRKNKKLVGNELALSFVHLVIDRALVLLKTIGGLSMELELVRSSHSVGRNIWTFEWCTKYRYEMMRKLENRNLVAACIRQAAFRHGIKILALTTKSICFSCIGN